MKDKTQSNEIEIETFFLEYANSIIATLREPFLVLDKNLRVISANQAFYTTFEVTVEETIGQSLPDIGNRQWNIPKLHQLLKGIIPEKKIVKDYEVEHDFEQIGQRFMLLNARQLIVPWKVAEMITKSEAVKIKEEELILLAIEDITERKRNITMRKKEDKALKESEARFKAIFNESTEGLLLADVESRQFFMCNSKICEMLGYTEAELLHMGIKDIHPEEELPFVIKQFERQVNEEIKLAASIPVKKKDGSIFYADISASHLTLDGKKYLMKSFRDITESKKIHDELNEKMHDLERFSKFAVDRELKMEELEKKIKELEGRLKEK